MSERKRSDDVLVATSAASAKDREIVITRLFNAPRELVWEVWTQPGHIKNWWGPNGFTNTIFKMDVMPEGTWDFIMHGPDGRDYHNKSTYTEVIKPEKLVYDHVTGPIFRFTVTFTEQGNQTLVSIQMVFDTTEQRDKVIREFKADEGLKQNMDKLETYLEKGYSTDELVFTRLLNAPRELVFKAFTDPTMLAKWWGPGGFTNPVCEIESRPGGKIYIEMKGPDGTIYPTGGEVLEVKASEKLVFTAGALDKDREQLFEVRITVTLSEENGQTKLTLHAKASRIRPGASTYINGMAEGWRQSLLRLINLVE